MGERTVSTGRQKPSAPLQLLLPTLAALGLAALVGLYIRSGLTPDPLSILPPGSSPVYAAVLAGSLLLLTSLIIILRRHLERLQAWTQSVGSRLKSIGRGLQPASPKPHFPFLCSSPTNCEKCRYWWGGFLALGAIFLGTFFGQGDPESIPKRLGTAAAAIAGTAATMPTLVRYLWQSRRARVNLTGLEPASPAIVPGLFGLLFAFGLASLSEVAVAVWAGLLA